MAKSFIEKLREQREKRIANNKAMVNREQKEFLNVEHLPAGVKTWWAKEGTEIRFRVLPFIVSKADNCAGEAVGSFGNVRRFKVHYLPNGRVVVCPKSFGKQCPLCDEFYAADEKDQKNRKSPIQRFKPKDRALFNALFDVPGEDGKNKKVMRVVNAGYFASWGKLMDEVKDEAGLKQNVKFQDKIYGFDDPETGYWIEARCNKASISGNDKDAFMQFTKMSLEWKAETAPLSEKVFEKLTDLDLLIPEPPTAEELRKLMGMDEPEAEDVPENEDADTTDEIEDDLDDNEEDGIPMGEVAEENTKKHKASKKSKKAEPAPEPEPEVADEPEEAEESPEADIEGESEATSDDDSGFDDDDFDFA